MPDAPDPHALVGTILAERFAVEALLARAPQAVLYRATHLGLGVRALVKVLDVPAAASPGGRALQLGRFAQEARVVAALDHPAIVRVLDCGALPGGLPWIAFEWLDGAPLSDELATPPGRRWSPVEALSLLRPIFDALACAHDVGVAHRDVQPANLVVVDARHGEAPLRLVGFGVARLLDDDAAPETDTTSAPDELASFAPSHAAPEQWTRLRTGPWTDVHALALLLTELLVGARAYRARDVARLRAEALRAERPTPGALGVDVGPWEAVLARALSLRAGERHADAASLLDELSGALPGAEDAWRRALAPDPRAGALRAPVVVAALVVLCALVAVAARVGDRGARGWSAPPVARRVLVRTDASAIRPAPPALPPAATPSRTTPSPVAPPPTRRVARPPLRARPPRAGVPPPELVID